MVIKTTNMVLGTTNIVLKTTNMVLRTTNMVPNNIVTKTTTNPNNSTIPKKIFEQK